MNLPVISVIMPVYNSGQYLYEAICSILNQTFIDFELIIIDDGSTDDSFMVIQSFIDKRIKVLKNTTNLGNYPSRNRGMKEAKGKYICIMDSDDISDNHRIEIQYKFLEDNIEIGLIGGAYKYLDKNYTIYRDTEYQAIKMMLMNFCYLHHPTCMIRTSLLHKHNLFYNEDYVYASDYDWQVRASSIFPISNINESILRYRIHENQISTSKFEEQKIFSNQIRINQLSYLGIMPTEAEKQIHLALLGKNDSNERLDISIIDRWIDRLISANKITNYYSTQKFQDLLIAYHKKYELDS